MNEFILFMVFVSSPTPSLSQFNSGAEACRYSDIRSDSVVFGQQSFQAVTCDAVVGGWCTPPRWVVVECVDVIEPRKAYRMPKRENAHDR